MGHISIDKTTTIENISIPSKVEPSFQFTKNGDLYIYGNLSVGGTTSLFPVGSVYVTSENVNPQTYLGGEWSLIRKSLKYQWLTSGFTWNNTNTQDYSTTATRYFMAIPNGNVIELRFQWWNKIAPSDTTITIGTFVPSSLGLPNTSIASHAIYGIVNADGLNAAGLAKLSPDTDNNIYTLSIDDYVTRTEAYPTSTNMSHQLSLIFNVQNTTHLLDSFCDEFHWKRVS